MKKLITLVLLAICSQVFAQSPFDKFEDKKGVKSVIVNERMFSLMSSVDMESTDPDTKTFLNLIKTLNKLKVFMTDNATVSNEMKASVSNYLKSNTLEELMRASGGDGRKVNIYIKSGATENRVKELLMYIYDASAKENKSIILSLTGNFNLKDISTLTKKMNLPGSEELKKVSKK